MYLWPPAASTGSDQSPGRLWKARGAMGGSTEAGRPISPSSTAPHSSRPGMSRWPGLRRKKVTVSAARGAKPRTRTGSAIDAGRHVDREQRRRGGGERFGREPIHLPPETGAEHGIHHEFGATDLGRGEGDGRSAPARSRLRCVAAGPGRSQARRPRPASRPAPTAAPRHSRRRRCCRGRRAPPCGTAGTGDCAARATARPAASMSAAPETPPAIAAASARAISAGVSSSSVIVGRPPRRGSPHMRRRPQLSAANRGPCRALTSPATLHAVNNAMSGPLLHHPRARRDRGAGAVPPARQLGEGGDLPVRLGPPLRIVDGVRRAAAAYHLHESGAVRHDRAGRPEQRTGLRIAARRPANRRDPSSGADRRRGHAAASHRGAPFPARSTLR